MVNKIKTIEEREQELIEINSSNKKRTITG